MTSQRGTAPATRRPAAIDRTAIPPDHEISRRSLFEGRLLVFAAIVVSALTLRVAVTAFTPLAARIGADIGYSTAVVGVFGMLPTAMFALGGLLTPILSRRLGLELTALVAMLMTGLGSALRAIVPDTWELLAFSAFALAGMGVGNIVIPPLVKRYFSDRLALLSSVYIVMVQLGTVFPALITVPVADAHGWRISLGMWAGLAFAAVLPWVAVLRVRRGAARADVTELPSEPIEATGKVWRSPLAWGMAFMFGMTSLITYSLFTWMPTIFGDAGASASFGGSMVGLFALFGLAAALAAPIVVGRMANPFPVVIGCAVFFFIGFAGLLIAPMSAPLLWVLALGLGPSTFPMALTLINLRTRTGAGSAALSGFTQGVGYSVACTGPLVFGALHTMTGGWLAPFGFLVLAVLVLMAGGWLACKPQLLEDTWN
ncbi:MFS transporter [Nocardia yunnanensis]|uniref:MFS transporter n=1 Tax=Nocardia yunnanensis TaxID=2382165 RepID=A0A386ZPF8_9NOCA|nr:MFS transporter [Nocardia yunnanensis]AYF78579.1 MFS transporter [Nocardia yunnanensis]